MILRRATSIRKFWTPGDVITLRRLFARAKFPWRDGSMSFSGGVTSGAGQTGTVNPWSGALIASGVGIYQDIMIPGVGPVRGYHAQGARTNLMPTGNTNGYNALTESAGSRSIAGIQSRRYTLTGGSTSHYATTASIPTLTGSTVYVWSVTFNHGTVSRLAIEVIGPDLVADRLVQVDNGVMSGSGAATSSIQALGGGWYRVSIPFTTIASPSVGAANFYRAIYAGAYGPYSGDGQSFELWGVSLEAAPFAGLYLPTAGAAVSRTADVWTWDMSAFGGLSATAGEVFCAAVPYLWSAGAGVGRSDANDAGLFNAASNTIYRNGGDNFIRYDGGGAQASTISPALAVDSGKSHVRSMLWGPTAVSLYRDGIFAGADSTVTNPWSTPSSMVVGAGLASEFFGLVVPGYVPGGMTDSERAALSRLFPASLAISA